jgi:hypothetical protein
MTAASKALKDRGVVLPESDLADIARTLRSALRAFAATNLEELSREVLVPYGTALLDLAKDDPVLAFTLKGRDSMSGPMKLLDSLQDPSPQDLDPDIRDDFIARLEVRVRREKLSDLEAVVQLVARRCSILTGRRVRRLIKEQAEARKKIASGAGVAELIDEVIQHAISTLAKKRQERELPQVKIPPSLR